MNLPLSEDLILECIDRHFSIEGAGIGLGRGDDCAIIWPVSDLCVSSDMFLEDIHFRRSYFHPDEIGYKALAVNISDIAAMGAKPLGFMLNMGLPQGVDLDWLDEFFTGMASLASECSIALIGGDLSAAPLLDISITAIGQKPEGCALLRRGGIMSGDALFLCGAIGLARVGLTELEAKGRAAMQEWPEACRAHLKPVPQTNAGLMLARAGYNARPPALMDVSDGLAADLPRLLGKAGTSLGAVLDINPISLHEEVISHASASGSDPVLEAVRGGEDYALLGACAPDMLPALRGAMPGLLTIGKVTVDGRIICNGIDITDMTGFDHFRSESSAGSRP